MTDTSIVWDHKHFLSALSWQHKNTPNSPSISNKRHFTQKLHKFHNMCGSEWNSFDFKGEFRTRMKYIHYIDISTRAHTLHLPLSLSNRSEHRKLWIFHSAALSHNLDFYCRIDILTKTNFISTHPNNTQTELNDVCMRDGGREKTKLISPSTELNNKANSKCRGLDSQISKERNSACIDGE